MDKINKKEKYKFCFPNLMAKMMKKVDMRTQMESSLLSMFLIMIGMTIMAIYLILYNEGSAFYKGLVLFNLLCGFLFISSFLVTTYHQYISFMDMMGIDPDKHKAEIKRRGNIIKRIYLAIKNKKSKNKTKELSLVKEALDNKSIIDHAKDLDIKELQKQADKLRKEANAKK